MLIVQIARRHSKAYLHIDHLANDATVHNLLYFFKIRQVAAIVGYKTRHAGLLRDTVDAGTVLIRGRQRLLHIDGFARFHGHNGVSGMTGRRRCNIDGIDISIVYQFLRIGIPTGNAVTLGIVTRLALVTTHHSHHSRTFYFRECRAAFFLSNLTTTDEAPLQ